MDIAWYIPLLIFFARLCDVPIGTIRVIFVINGAKLTAAVLGFFEVIIWALAVGGVITYLREPIALVAYGGGFAMGTLIGMHVEQKLAVGWRMIRVVNPDPDVHVAEMMRESGYRVTSVPGRGQRGPVEVAFLAIKRKDVPEALERIHEVAPGSFVTIERTERASVISPMAGESALRRSLGKFSGVRK